MKHNIFLTYCHEIVGIAMKWIVQQHFPLSAISEARNFQSAFDDLPKKQYDLVVLDAEIEDSANVVSLVKYIKSISPKTRILIFSELDETIYGPKYLAFGTNGFLVKKSNIESIILAMKTALRGDIFFGNQQNVPLFVDDESDKNGPFDILSKRETEIIERLVRGVPLTEISKQMNLKETTISTYKKRIFEKTGARTLSDLIALWKIYR
ncbi:LuxR C-terminal-related transcriptional regulator [Parapedobacter sp. GCM10030251]|uniref:LuxR C-terminal-related transcriptional regulator n=1 Tax=Parapedobacter sp. GCM10030251 TaxID=3273419 RepID=UPI00361D1CC1